MVLKHPTDCPYYLISRVTLQAASALKRGLAEAGVGQVKPAYLGVLLGLWYEDGLKVVELSRRAGLEPSTMTGLLDRMERDELIIRKSDPSDRRALLIQLTEKGHELEKPVHDAVERVLGGVFSGISEEDLSRTMNLLRKVLTNIQEGNG